MKWISSRPSPSCEKLPLNELLSNQLEDDKAAIVTKHLDQCEYCQRRLTELSAEATWWQEAAQWLENAAVDDSEIAEGALDDFEEHHAPSAESALIQSGLMKPTSKPELIGAIGRYDIRRVIGTGGTGIVLQALDTELDRVVAVKVLAPTLASNGPARRRFSREGQAAASVVHDNVVAIHHVESSGPIPFIVMQFVEGSSLQELVIRSGPIDVKSTLRIIAQLASALAAAHSQGLVHRDVKPANILVGATGQRVWITDFGLARAVDDASLTRTGFIAGTPHYMSPEQARGETVGASSDLFGLGSVMYFALTGRPPFRADRSLAVLNRICHERHRPVREVNPDVPQPVAAIVDRLLEKVPAVRFQSAEDVRVECLRLLSDPDAFHEPTLRLVDEPVTTYKRSRTAVLVSVLVVSLIASGLARQFARYSELRSGFSMLQSGSSGVTIDDSSADANPFLKKTPVSANRIDSVPRNALASASHSPNPLPLDLRPLSTDRQSTDVRGRVPVAPASIAPASEPEIWQAAFTEVEREFESLTLFSSSLELHTRGPQTANIGQRLGYSATLANPGDRDVENVKLLMQIPAGMQVVSASPQPRLNENQLLWDHGVLPTKRQLDVSVVLEPHQNGDYSVFFRGTGNPNLNYESSVVTRVAPRSVEVVEQPFPTSDRDHAQEAFEQEFQELNLLLRDIEVPVDESTQSELNYSVSQS